MSESLPVGRRLEAVLELAYRARIPVLLEGATGIGKSEIIASVATRIGIGAVVLDLTMLEPTDLVGLPRIVGGRTVHAVPAILPRDGAGILILEELNRAERLQNTALQLLTYRRFHAYELPEAWVCISSINPESPEYFVSRLDGALRARFQKLSVHASRPDFIVWAQTHGIHPAIVALAQTHERILDQVPPRTWTYVSRTLQAPRPVDLADSTLLHDALGGFLPPAWVETLLATMSSGIGALSFDVRALLTDYAPGTPLARTISDYRENGRTDRLDEVTERLTRLLASPEAGLLCVQRRFSIADFLRASQSSVSGASRRGPRPDPSHRTAPASGGHRHVVVDDPARARGGLAAAGAPVRALVDPTFLPARGQALEQDPLSNRARGFPAHGLPVVSRAAALRSRRVLDGATQAMEPEVVGVVARPALRLSRA